MLLSIPPCHNQHNCNGGGGGGGGDDEGIEDVRGRRRRTIGSRNAGNSSGKRWRLRWCGWVRA
jgi:hypothetical protein